MRLNLQRFVKNKNVSSSHTSQSSNTSSSSSSSSKTSGVSKTNGTSKTSGTSKTNGTSKTSGTTKTSGTSKTSQSGGATTNTNGWENGTSTTKNVTVKSEDTLAAEDAWKKLSEYSKSPEAQAAYAKKLEAEQAYKNKGEYQSNYKEQIDNLLKDILDRKEFSYDFVSDPMYQQYRDQYAQMGKEAMLNTQAAASALTGGYGSSYATTAGSQAYQDYLRQANDKIPELYQLALQKYDSDQQAKLNQFNALGTQEDREYSQYNNDLQNALAYMNYAQGDYGTESQNNLSLYQTQLQNAQAMADYLYQQDYATQTETSSQNGSTAQESNWSKSDTSSEETAKSNQTTKSKETTKSSQTTKSKETNKSSQSTHSSEHSSSSTNSTSSTSGTNVDQNTILREIDEDEVNAVKAYVDAGDTTKAKNYIASMRMSGKYSDKQIQAVCEMAGMSAGTKKPAKKKK